MRGLRRPRRETATSGDVTLSRHELDRRFAKLLEQVDVLRREGALDDPHGLDARSRKQRGKAFVSTRRGYAALAEQLGRYVVLETDGRAFVVSTADARMFSRRETKEARLLRAALAHMQTAGSPVVMDTFVDGGANVGSECLAALTAGFLTAVACEPEHENFRLLLANLALNGDAGRVRALELALSSEEGRVRLEPGDRTRRKARIVTGGEGTGVDEVRAATLDGLAREDVFDPARVGLLWLDVEGYEVHALRGATALLDRSVPIVMELNIPLLTRAGSIDDLPEVLSSRYTHVLDLGLSKSVFEPLLALPDLAARYAPDAGTNVLVARLAPR